MSTDRQEYGIEAQRQSIDAEASRRGWTVAWVEDVGRSGRDIDRPGITNALDELGGGRADALVVAKLDRLSRSLADFARLLETASRQGWSVVALDLGIDTTTPTGKLVANVMAAVAQWERETIGLRTREALAQAKTKGVHVGRPQAQNPSVVRRIRNLRTRGHSYRAIAGRFNAEGVATVGGGRWHPNSVRSAERRTASSAVALTLEPMKSEDVA